MRVRGRSLLGPLYASIEDNSSSYTLDRRRGRDESVYGGGENYEEGAAQADLYLFRPTQDSGFTVSGEQQTGELRGLALPDADVEEGDRLTYGSHRYEIELIDPTPSVGNHITTELVLTRVEAEYSSSY